MAPSPACAVRDGDTELRADADAEMHIVLEGGPLPINAGDLSSDGSRSAAATPMAAPNLAIRNGEDSPCVFTDGGDWCTSSTDLFKKGEIAWNIGVLELPACAYPR